MNRRLPNRIRTEAAVVLRTDEEDVIATRIPER